MAAGCLPFLLLLPQGLDGRLVLGRVTEVHAIASGTSHALILDEWLPASPARVIVRSGDLPWLDAKGLAGRPVLMKPTLEEIQPGNPGRLPVAHSLARLDPVLPKTLPVWVRQLAALSRYPLLADAAAFLAGGLALILGYRLLWLGTAILFGASLGGLAWLSSGAWSLLLRIPDGLWRVGLLFLVAVAGAWFGGTGRGRLLCWGRRLTAAGLGWSVATPMAGALGLSPGLLGALLLPTSLALPGVAVAGVAFVAWISLIPEGPAAAWLLASMCVMAVHLMAGGRWQPEKPGRKQQTGPHHERPSLEQVPASALVRREGRTAG